jgi:hypothetical protein
MNIISALPDEPNDEGGLSATALKAKFDEPGNVMKAFINDSLLPDLDAEISSKINEMELQSGNMPTGGTAGQLLVKKSGADFDAEYRDPAPAPTAATTPVSADAAAALSLGENATVEAGLLSLESELAALEASVPENYVAKSSCKTGAFAMAVTDITETLAKSVNLGARPKAVFLTLVSGLPSNQVLWPGSVAAVNLPADTYVPIFAGVGTNGSTLYVQKVFVKFTATGFSVYNWPSVHASFYGTWQYFAVL